MRGGVIRAGGAAGGVAQGLPGPGSAQREGPDHHGRGAALQRVQAPRCRHQLAVAGGSHSAEMRTTEPDTAFTAFLRPMLRLTIKERLL